MYLPTEGPCLRFRGESSARKGKTRTCHEQGESRRQRSMGVRFAHNPLHVQQATPPSAEKVAPVVKLESSLSAKHIVLAMSSGVPSRCRGRVLYVFVRGW